MLLTFYRYMVVLSGKNAGPLIVGYFPTKFFYQLLVRWLFQSAWVKEDGALMTSPSVVDESLRAVDSTTEKRCGPHPGRGKLYAVHRWDHHAEGWISSTYLDRVRAAIEFKGVVGCLVGNFVFFRVVTRLERRYVYGVHNILLDIFFIIHPGYFLYDSS